MLGSAMMRGMSDSKGLEIYGTIRSGDSRRWFAPPVAARLIEVRDVRDYEALAAVFAFSNVWRSVFASFSVG